MENLCGKVKDCGKTSVCDNVKFEYWRKTLKESRYVVAPMVDASELAWRMLSRRYGAELCYTPMLHANVFVNDARYRKDNLESCDEDRPLIVQFCANDPEVFAKACRLASPFCDGIDLNLGCPQAIARKGHYGAFLMEEWYLIKEMIERAREDVDIPVSAKIRIFPELKMTLEYARMLESAGISLLTVHGRTRDQKGALTGLANWDVIKAVRESVSVPVFANGNIQCLDDVHRCLEVTGVQGVMSAEGNLHNPAIFSGESPTVGRMTLEYLELAKRYPCPLSYCRGHVFKLMHHVFNMKENFDIRYRMSKAPSLDVMIDLTKELETRLRPYVEGETIWESENDVASNGTALSKPPWICQPYVRIPAEEHLKKLEESRRKAEQRRQDERETKRDQGEGEPEGERLSRKKMKRLEKNPYKKFKSEPEPYEKCSCKNPMGSRCSYMMCRTCCKFKCHLEDLECAGHKIKKRKETKDEKNDLEKSPTPVLRELTKCNNDNDNSQILGKSTAENQNGEITIGLTDNLNCNSHVSEEMSFNMPSKAVIINDHNKGNFEASEEIHEQPDS